MFSPLSLLARQFLISASLLILPSVGVGTGHDATSPSVSSVDTAEFPPLAQLKETASLSFSRTKNFAFGRVRARKMTLLELATHLFVEPVYKDERYLTSFALLNSRTENMERYEGGGLVDGQDVSVPAFLKRDVDALKTALKTRLGLDSDEEFGELEEALAATKRGGWKMDAAMVGGFELGTVEDDAGKKTLVPIYGSEAILFNERASAVKQKVLAKFRLMSSEHRSGKDDLLAEDLLFMLGICMCEEGRGDNGATKKKSELFKENKEMLLRPLSKEGSNQNKRAMVSARFVAREENYLVNNKSRGTWDRTLFREQHDDASTRSWGGATVAPPQGREEVRGFFGFLCPNRAGARQRPASSETPTEAYRRIRKLSDVSDVANQLQDLFEKLKQQEGGTIIVAEGDGMAAKNGADLWLHQANAVLPRNGVQGVASKVYDTYAPYANGNDLFRQTGFTDLAFVGHANLQNEKRDTFLLGNVMAQLFPGTVLDGEKRVQDLLSEKTLAELNPKQKGLAPIYAREQWLDSALQDLEAKLVHHADWIAEMLPRRIAEQEDEQSADQEERLLAPSSKLRQIFGFFTKNSYNSLPQGRDKKILRVMAPVGFGADMAGQDTFYQGLALIEMVQRLNARELPFVAHLHLAFPGFDKPHPLWSVLSNVGAWWKGAAAGDKSWRIHRLEGVFLMGEKFYNRMWAESSAAQKEKLDEFIETYGDLPRHDCIMVKKLAPADDEEQQGGVDIADSRI